MGYETKYRALWHMLRRIQIGEHEKGGLITIEDARQMAALAIGTMPVPAKILPGYELEAK